MLRAMVFDGYAVVTFTDVSMLRETQAALRSAEQQLQQTAYDLTENIPVGTYTMVQPPDGGMAQFAFMSTRFLELTGLNREEAASDPLKGFACVHPDEFDAWVTLNAEAFKNKTPFYGETRVVVDGKTHWISAESVPRALPDGSTVWEGVLADISTRKAAEQQLVENKLRAERLEKAKSAFLANMSHEIRTPMNAVLGLTELLMRSELEPSQRQMVTRIQHAGELLLSIIDDVLDLSRIEAGKLAIRERAFSLAEVLERIRNLYQFTAAAKGLTLRVSLAGQDQPPRLFGDPLRVEQVLGNLVSNAIKFTKEGEVVVSAQVLRQSEQQAWLHFSVTDTGIGLASENQEALFEPFVQVDWADGESYSGTGLGLSISARLVRLMGGQMGVESTLGVSSVFWFELPFKLGDSEGDQAQAAQRVEIDRHLLQGRCLLVVDDGELNRYLVREFVEALGGECAEAVNADEAMQMLDADPQRYSAVLMDVQMPGLDGLEATRQLRKDPRFKGLPIVAFTAGAMEEQRQAALAAGMNDVLLKPLSLEQMAACFRLQVGSGEPGWKAFSDFPGIDPAHAFSTMDGNLDLLKRLIGIFREEFSDVLTAVQQDLANNDLPAACRRLHNIRGSATQLGALELAKAAGELEDALQSGQQANDRLINSFESALNRLFKIPAS